jgi:AcrR family transcriptional regulator
MPRSASDTRQRILSSAYPLFYRDGFSRVSVDAIAAAAGVTKKTLYYHFDSKDALVGAILGEQHEHALRLVKSWAHVESRDPLVLAGTIFERFARWAAQPGWHGSGFTRITMELADMPGHPARLSARRHKRAVEDMLTSRFAECGVSEAEIVARQIVLLIEGTNALMLIHGKADYAEAAAATARLIVSSHKRPTRSRGNGATTGKKPAPRAQAS